MQAIADDPEDASEWTTSTMSRQSSTSPPAIRGAPPAVVAAAAQRLAMAPWLAQRRRWLHWCFLTKSAAVQMQNCLRPSPGAARLPGFAVDVCSNCMQQWRVPPSVPCLLGP